MYNAAVSYIASITAWQGVLAGDDPAPGDAGDWHEVAETLARELRRYADFLDRCRTGQVSGPIVFPSWRLDQDEDHRPRKPACDSPEPEDRRA